MTSLPVTVVIRIIFGLFVIGGPDCRLPTVVRLIGFLEFASAAVLLGLGAERLERFVEWALQSGGEARVLSRAVCVEAAA